MRQAIRLADASDHTPDLATREDEALDLIARGALPEAEAVVRDMLLEHPDNPNLLPTLGTLASHQNRYPEAIALLERAVALGPGEPVLAKNLATVRDDMVARVQELMTRGAWAEAAAALRDILKAEPRNIFATNSLIHCVMEAGDAGRLSDYAPDLTEDDLGCHIFIACMPKSGSTYLRAAMLALTGWQEARLTYAFLQNEEELYLPHLREVACINTVVQQHCRATVPNLQLMQAFKIRPVVLVRNLFDAVVSYADFFDTSAIKNTFFTGRWDDLPRGRRLDLVIDNYVPWYTAFHASWADVMAKGQLDCAFLTYEEMIADKLGTLAKLCGFYGLRKSPDECMAALAFVEAQLEKLRFNKGRAGRGADELSAAQKDRIRALAAYYPDVDFGPVGL